MDRQLVAVAVEWAAHSTAVAGAAEKTLAGVSVPEVCSLDRTCQCALVAGICSRHFGVLLRQGPWVCQDLHMSCQDQVSNLTLQREQHFEWGDADEARSTEQCEGDLEVDDKQGVVLQLHRSFSYDDEDHQSG